jgi:GT2 family glycosyltransferase
MASVGIVIVTWNGADISRRCLASVRQLDYPDIRVCLVDNGSTPPLAPTLSAEFPEIETVTVASNRGYAAGCNAGLRWAKQSQVDYVFLLNDDTTLDPQLIRCLLRRSELGEGPCIIAPKILMSDRPGIIWSAGGKLRWPWLKSDNIGCGEEDVRYDEPRAVSWATGCALFFPLPVIDRVGHWDERYFLYLDDVEWCMRAARRGVRVYYEPRARLFHDVSATNEQLDKRIIRYYAYRNYYLLAFTHTGPIGKVWFGFHLALTLAKTGARALLFPSYRRDSQYHARTKALFDVLRRRYGKAPYPDEIRLLPEEGIVKEATI